MSATTEINMSSAPVAVVDLLQSLLEAAVNSVFRFMGEGSPYLSRATVEVRRPLAQMVIAEHRRAGELANAIESLGVTARPKALIRREEQFLAFLSLKFLLPKLVDEKKLHIERYENAIEAMSPLPQVPPEMPALLQSHLAELRNELVALEQAAAHIARSTAAAKDPSQPAGGTKKNSDAGPAAG
jgi:hypothetical protein